MTKDILADIDAVLFENYEPELDHVLSTIFSGFEHEGELEFEDDSYYKKRYDIDRLGFSHYTHGSQCFETKYDCEHLGKKSGNWFSSYGFYRVLSTKAYTFGLNGGTLSDFTKQEWYRRYVVYRDNNPYCESSEPTLGELGMYCLWGIRESHYLDWEE